MKLMFKLLLLAGLTMPLSACFDSDDDDKMDNVAPETADASYTTQADIAFSEILDASDPDDDALSFMIEEEPSLGTVELNGNGEFTYTPSAQVTGMDSFVFLVSDGINDPVTGTVTITIENQQVSFTNYTRDAFAQNPADEPLPVNGRRFTDDSNETSFDDLLMDQ